MKNSCKKQWRHRPGYGFCEQHQQEYRQYCLGCAIEVASSVDELAKRIASEILTVSASGEPVRCTRAVMVKGRNPDSERDMGGRNAASIAFVVRKHLLAAGYPGLSNVVDVGRKAMDERDETRRWLLDIALELGVACQLPGDEKGPPHEAWRRLYGRIMATLKGPKNNQDVSNLIARINGYLQSGGLLNPEMMEHDKVRNLLLDCREALANQQGD